MDKKITSEQLLGKPFTALLDRAAFDGKGHTVEHCPLCRDDPAPVCFPSCYFYDFRLDQCDYNRITRETRDAYKKPPRSPVGHAGDS